MSTAKFNSQFEDRSIRHRRGFSPVDLDSSLFEACERRLVLSAQLMFEVLGNPVLGDPSLQMHGEIADSYHGDSFPIDQHLAEAHAATGWNAVQQEFGLTGKGQTVAVIDSGIAWDHIALGGGYGPGYRVVGGWDFTEENDANPYDDGPSGFHGTHVSGIIGSDSPEHIGVAPDVDLVALRVFNDAGQGQLSWVERALQWVHDNRTSFDNPITTVNLSLGTTWNDDVIPNWATLEEELQTLFNDGILVTASAGNSFQTYHAPGVSYPAASPYVLPVASVDDQGYLSSFSQRNDSVIAAPGERIVSTVPDHVLGRDGKIDDFAAASGTSMAAPYVAGASVLVRQAMEMVGYAGINLTSIANHLHATADSVFDADTGASYDRLNLQNAIDSLIPDDTIGDVAQSAASLDVHSSQLDGWINSLSDSDVYRFTPDSNGTLSLDAHSDWLSSLQWTLQTSSGTIVSTGGMDSSSVQLSSGETYNLTVSANHEIGSFRFDVNFASSGDSSGGSGTSGGGGVVPTPPTSTPTNLGAVDYLAQSTEAGQYLRVQATHDGVFSVQWSNPDAPSGNLSVQKDGGNWQTDTSWSGGALRLDLDVTAGQWINILLPGQGGDNFGGNNHGGRDLGELAIANLLSRSGSELTVNGTMGSDDFAVDLQAGLKVRVGDIEYAYAEDVIDTLTVDSRAGNDHIAIVGSSGSDKVDLRPTGTTLENSHIQVVLSSIEQVDFSSGGGPDRVYLYDSDGDDTLTARPRSAELVGVGYRFGVSDVDRIFIHATGGGQDYAYLYDSSGDDRLSMRPQFSSLSGSGFFNYVSGFERVYAYANAGGIDQADLYDSGGNDRFSTSGASASIVGPGFSSFTRSFEQVRAFADSGGADMATLYGAGAQTQWQQGSDFVNFREDGLSREARGFASVETYVAGQAQSLAPWTTASITTEFAPLMQSADGTASVELPQSAAAWDPLSYPLSQTDPADDLSSIEPQASFGNDPTTHALPELQVLRQTRHMSDWLSERLILPEEKLLANPDAELALLDEVFSEFSADTPSL